VRVAALYDVHGNLPALDAVLVEVELEGIEHVLSGGDLVAGAAGRECLERLLALGAHRVSFVRGNADREVEELADVVDEWPPGEVMHGFERLGPVHFCHATPAADDEIITRLTPDDVLRARFPAGLTIVGHTHVQFDRSVDDRRIVNAGSVGMPYEAEPGAYWAVIGPDVTLRRTLYDGAPVPKVGPDEASAYFESIRGA
jgi:predicted phosphodiesterase